jgi:virginiamycin B lyase
MTAIQSASAATRIDEFPIPSHNITFGIAADHDGSVWFTTLGPTKTVGHVLPSGEVTEFPILTTAANLGGMVIGPDDNIWFSEWSGRGGSLPLTRIGRVSRDGSNFREFPIPASDNEFYDRIAHYLVVGPDANIWFTAGSDALGRITMAGDMTLYLLPPADECFFGQLVGPSPFGLTVGPDGALWLAAGLGHAVLRFSLAATQFEKLSVVLCESGATDLAFGPDGNLWFTSWNGGSLYRLSMQTGETNVFPGFDGPFGLVATGGHLFMTRPGRTDTTASEIVRINTETGSPVASYPVPTPNALPIRIVVDPAGNIWFNEQNGLKIGRLQNIASCLASITPSYQNGTLALRIVLKSDTPAWWGAWLAFDDTVVPMWIATIPAVAPAVFYDLRIPGYPQVGTVGVLTILTNTSAQICGDWLTVDTGGVGSTVEDLEHSLRKSGVARFGISPP